MEKLRNKYSLSENMRLAWWLLRTKMIDRKARLFRFPLDIRGRAYIDFGESLTTGVGCRLECFPGVKPGEKKLFFGKNVQINDYVHIVAMDHIRIGDHVLMASHVFISDNSHGSYKGDEHDSPPDVPPTERLYQTAPVVIGDNCWIGEGVFIMPGVEIGEGCVIGAHSIICQSIPPRTIAVGTPAKVIKRWNPDKHRWLNV